MMDEVKKSKEETLAVLRAQISALEAELTAKKTVIDKYQSRDEGWLILCKNLLYDGVTADIRFHNGATFIPKTAVLQRFVVEVPSENILKGYSAEERERILENTKMPSAERAMIHLTQDFGYEAEFYSKDQSEIIECALGGEGKRTARTTS